MREVHASIIEEAVRDLCIQANKVLPTDLIECIKKAHEHEEESLPKGILFDLLENLDAAKELDIPICQDTGMAVIFAEIGQDIHITGGNFEDAVNNGVRCAYTKGLLRCSIVSDPLNRTNTGDNTPAIIHTRIVPGDKIALTAAPKGFGSENMSAIKMFTPSATREDIIHFVVDCVETAAGNPCPPIVLGIGIGGDFEYCAYLSKKALCRSVSEPNPDSFYQQLEEDIFNAVNQLSVGVQGFGGKNTALAVNIETAPTHIAGLPVAVNIGCHVTRHAKKII